MKKIFIAFIIVLTTTNCSQDYLQRESLTQIAEGNFWQSEADAFLALNAVYSTLQSRSLYGGNLNGFQGIPGYDGIGDNAYTQFEYEGPALFMEGTMDPTHGMILNLWNNSYQGIARVNSVIQNVEIISEDLVSAETKEGLLGQAYFLRALFYFNLSVYFEDVPLITAPQTLEEAYVSKNTFEEVTAQIVEDLKLAVEYLPEAQPSGLEGYATKGAALGLFARVQLYNKVYEGPEGVIELTNQLLGLNYDLHPDYGALFTPENELSQEVVFAVRFLRGDDTANGENFSATFLGTPKVDQRPMPNLVNDYYCTDGQPISTSPLYSAANPRNNRDPRALATIYFRGDQYLVEPARTFTGNSPTGFGMRKYIRRGPDAEGNAVFGDGSQGFYVIRFADVLLMRAEALTETGNIDGAVALVDRVRARVNMPSVAEAEGTVNQAQMRAIVRHERRVELALEGLRFMDLKRWGDIEGGIQRASSDPVGPYAPQYLGRRSEVFPIPQSEVDVNKNLVQNPAWQ
ncbi:MAG: RagB/SusD family nutrient uptake outer membrane protein [Leeuwenhoekiella sp.]|nr:MAG: RagB/SusD family nutrient uptake outer membrane protein [Leeuwenhoekiella sp.]